MFVNKVDGNKYSMPVKGDRKQNMKQDHYDIVVNYIIANQKKFYRLAYTCLLYTSDAADE